MGPLWGPEFPKISQERLQNLWGFTPAAAGLNTRVLKSKNRGPGILEVWQVYGTLDTCMSRFEVISFIINGLAR
jgi:hypothetical protein